MRLPPLPELPKFPSYEPVIAREMNTIKAEVQKAAPEIPIRQKPVMNQMPPREMQMPKPEPRPMEFRPERVTLREEKPLFIKIDKYKEALRLIDNVKARLSEAEHILDELHRIKQDEDRQLQSWRNDIEKLKEKLLDADKTLFEV